MESLSQERGLGFRGLGVLGLGLDPINPKPLNPKPTGRCAARKVSELICCLCLRMPGLGLGC